MPKIETYESNIVGDTEQKYNVADTTAIGKGLENLGQGLEKGTDDVANAYRSLEDRTQSTKASVFNQTLKSGITTKFRQQSQAFDISDPNAQDNYFQDADAQADQFASTLTSPVAYDRFTKQWASTKASMWGQVTKNNAALVGKDVTEDTKQFQQTNTTNVYNNPDGLDDAMDDIDSHVHTLMGPDWHKQALTGQMKRGAAISAFKGTMDNPDYGGPDEALKMLNSGKLDNYLIGDDKSNLERSAQTTQDRMLRQQELNVKKAQVANDQGQRQAHQDMYLGLEDGDIDFQKINEASATGKINEAQARDLTDRLQSHVDGTFQGDANTFNLARKRLALPDGDPNKITDFQTLTSEYNLGKGKGLSQDNLKTLTSIYLSPKDADDTTKAAFTNLINKSADSIMKPTLVPWGDRQGMALWAQSVNQMHADYQKGVASGVNSQVLLDPKSPQWVGKSIADYARTRQEMAAQAGSLIHQPTNANLSAGYVGGQPPGANSKMTPMPQGAAAQTPSKNGGFTDAQMEVLKNIGPQKAGK